MTEDMTIDGPHPDVTPRQVELCERYGKLLTNTGGNDPLDLLQDLQWPGRDGRPNYIAATNVVRFTLAVAVQAQVNLLGRLEQQGMLSA